MNSEITSRWPALYSPWRIDSRGGQKLLRFIRRDRRAATANVTNSYNNDDLDNDSQHTVPRVLSRKRLRSWRSMHVPALTTRYRQQAHATSY